MAQVGWLLYNGKVRRKVGAVVRFHPVTELLVRTETEMQAGTGCPGTAQARTYAGYLLQFLGDRPEQFRLERGRRHSARVAIAPNSTLLVSVLCLCLCAPHVLAPVFDLHPKDLTRLVPTMMMAALASFGCHYCQERFEPARVLCEASGTRRVARRSTGRS